jgi:hypothetical protein
VAREERAYLLAARALAVPVAVPHLEHSSQRLEAKAGQMSTVPNPVAIVATEPAVALVAATEEEPAGRLNQSMLASPDLVAPVSTVSEVVAVAVDYQVPVVVGLEAKLLLGAMAWRIPVAAVAAVADQAAVPRLPAAVVAAASVWSHGSSNCKRGAVC